MLQKGGLEVSSRLERRSLTVVSAEIYGRSRDKRGMLEGPLSEQQVLYLKKQLMRSLITKMPMDVSMKVLQALFPEAPRE